jgi:DNA-directed RNA polymerase subunit alpha
MFQRPRRIEWEELTPRFGRMVAEPFEKGYALTVGHSLRRVLLSAIPGAAIEWVKIEGLGEGQGTLPGVREDVTTLCLNLKKIVVRVPDDKPLAVRVELRGPKAAMAADLAVGGLDIASPDLPVATLEPGGRLAMELGVRTGRGYESAERHADRPPAGAVALDARFTPIERVNYAVEMSRLGKITDYEKLVLEIWTDGTIAPDQALLRASKLLREHFDLFTPAGAEEEDEEPPVQPAEVARPV